MAKLLVDFLYLTRIYFKTLKLRGVNFYYLQVRNTASQEFKTITLIKAN